MAEHDHRQRERQRPQRRRQRRPQPKKAHERSRSQSEMRQTFSHCLAEFIHKNTVNDNGNPRLCAIIKTDFRDQPSKLDRGRTSSHMTADDRTRPPMTVMSMSPAPRYAILAGLALALITPIFAQPPATASAT